MNSKERVYRSIEFNSPDKVPVYYFNGEVDKGDLVCFDVKRSAAYAGKEKALSEWGYTWRKLDDTMGQPDRIVIGDYSQLDSYVPPKADAPGHFDGLEEFIQEKKDKFIMVGPDITGFNIVTFLRGFENTLFDLYEDMENLQKVIDMVFGYELGLIEVICRYKDVDAFSFHDDWGSQRAMFISPVKFREVFLPLYKKQFDLLHKHGKKVFFHSCGYVFDIIPDLISAGVDIFNFNQPDVMGLDKLSGFRGKVAFNCPVDLQKVAVEGTKEQIFDYTVKMIKQLGTDKGGFIGYLEEYHSIGLTDENYLYCEEALKKGGRYDT